MWKVYVIGVILSFCHTFCLALLQASSQSINMSCTVIESSLFQIDLKCVSKLAAIENVQNSSAVSAQLCTNQCQLDIFYWDRSELCIAMSADVLNSCPLISDGTVSSPKSRLFFSVSNKMPQVVTEALVSKGYKFKLAELLNCNLHKFLCDDLTCIDWKYRCDGVYQCQDKSDELSCPGQQKCLGRDGKYYSVGEEYAPQFESDVCKICVCGAGSSAAYCYSPLCSTKMSECSGSSPNVCCRCFEDSYLKNSNSILGYSQRLLVSCLSVLFLISLLLILSRGFTQQGLRRPANQRMTQSNWISMTSRGLPPNRSFFETNSVRPCAVDFFNRDADVPPPYSSAKPNENEEVNELPPSYEASTLHSEHPDGVTVTSPGENSNEEEERVRIESDSLSPLRSTLNCPLLRSDSTAAQR